MPPMTLAEAGALLGLSPGTLNVQARRGRLRAKKIGDRWHVTPAEVERYRREVLGKPGWQPKAAPKAKPFLQPAIDAAKAKMTPEQRALLDAPLPADFVPRFCPAPKPSARKKRRKVRAE